MGTEAKPGPWELPGGLGPVGEPLEGPWCSEQHRLESRSPRGRAAPLGPCDVHLRTSWGHPTSLVQELLNVNLMKLIETVI